MSLPLHIFVLADTHNHLPANIEALAEGADEIWHLGDVCSPTILDELRQFGPPLRVVRGNCDDTLDWPANQSLTVGTPAATVRAGREIVFQ